MPAIQAMRSDALALRAKEDVQEKIPSFFNSVNKALGQNIITGQDAAQQLAESRFAAANQLAASIRQKIDGQGALSELIAGAGMDLINSTISLVLAVLQKTTTTDALETASAIANFLLERETLQLQWDAAAATFAQWTVQAGYTGHGDFFPAGTTTPAAQTKEFNVTQWLRATIPTPPVPGGGAGGPTGDRFDSLRNATFVGQTAQPPNLELYEYADQNAAQRLFGGTTNRSISVGFDRSGDGQFGRILGSGAQHMGTAPGSTVSQGDTSSYLYREVGTNNYWLRYDFTMEGTEGTTVDIPRITASNIVSDIDYDLGTGTITNNGNTYPNTQDNSDTSITQWDTNPPTPYSDPNDFDGTTISDNGTPGDPSDDFPENPPENYPDDPYFHRTGNLTAAAGFDSIEIPPPRPVYEKAALGGRGATTYRDALTPRWTDRDYYRNSSLTGTGADPQGNNYDTYYAWGSVGSISRVGRY